MAIGPTPWVLSLLEIYGKRMPDVNFSRIDIPNSTPALDYIEDGMADVSIVPADIVYVGFNKGTETRAFPHRKLRGMAVMHMAAIHLIATDRLDIHSLKDLRGKRIGIGPTGTSTTVTVPLVLAQLGIAPSDIRLEQLPYDDTAKQLRNGSLDADFVFSAFPAETPETLLAVPGTHLVSIPEPEILKLREKFSFLRPVVIPAEAYGTKENIRTLGVNFLFVCREGLDEDLVYNMLSVFFDSVPELSKLRAALRVISFDQAPGTPIPLHAGAERFYREHQLFN